jgi:hypothetical protein
MPLPAFSFAIQAALPWGVALKALLLFQERHLPVDRGNHRDTQELQKLVVEHADDEYFQQ